MGIAIDPRWRYVRALKQRTIELKEDAEGRSKDGDKGDDKACFWERDPSEAFFKYKSHEQYGEIISEYQSRKRNG